MHERDWKMVMVSAVLIMVTTFWFASLMGRATAREASSQTVRCRVLEVHMSLELRLTVVVFHHRDESERARLGILLRQHSGAPVEIQDAGGGWHRATVLRLKSCFGRGLLLLPAGTVQLAEKDEFLLKFPSE